MSQTDDERLKLEVLVTEHERLLEQFSEMIRNQQAQIDRLGQKLERIERKLAENDEADADRLIDEPPPHY